MVQPVPIRSHTIRLGQLLKLAGLVDSGSEVKALLAHEPVLVNREPEARRGRQLHPGDSVTVGEHELRVIAAEPQPAESQSADSRRGAQTAPRPAQPQP